MNEEEQMYNFTPEQQKTVDSIIERMNELTALADVAWKNMTGGISNKVYKERVKAFKAINSEWNNLSRKLVAMTPIEASSHSKNVLFGKTSNNPIK